MDHQACQLSSRCRQCHREGRRCSCSIHLWSGPGHDRSHRPIKENHISNEVPAPILQNYPLTTTTANDTITNHPRHPKLITLSLCVAKYAGGSSIPISSQAETDDGPWPSIARHGRTDGTEYVGDTIPTANIALPPVSSSSYNQMGAFASPNMPVEAEFTPIGPGRDRRWPLALHRPPRTAQNMSAIRQ